MNPFIEAYGRGIVFASVISFYVIMAYAFLSKDHSTLVRFNYLGEAHLEFIIFGIGIIPSLILTFNDACNTGKRFWQKEKE